MECLVYRRGEAVGTLKIEEDGLYRILTARIPLYREILRLYVPQAMGVFVPEEGSLICRRRISRGKLPVKPVFACAWCEKDSLWSAESKGLRRRWLPEGVELAMRWQTEAPMCFPAAPDRLKPVLIENVAYLTCLLPYEDQ
ncbi:MAG: hypothetical protein E7464_06670 [Ruminococcaceae bacterium]|nr:hypothetical protein [Oscillospiraceae bacterium]